MVGGMSDAGSAWRGECMSAGSACAGGRGRIEPCCVMLSVFLRSSIALADPHAFIMNYLRKKWGHRGILHHTNCKDWFKDMASPPLYRKVLTVARRH